MSRIRRTVTSAATSLLLLAQVATEAQAAPSSEVGDAGRLPATAQQPVGSGPLDSISGTLSAPGDVDLYRICLTGGGTFSASTLGTPGSLLDTQLFLFGAGGLGIEANDDSGGTFRSLLPAGGLAPATPGVYYLGISAFDDDPASNSPASAAGLIFPNTFSGVVGPTGPGGGSPLADWTGNTGESGTYSITLTGATFCAPSAVCASPPPPPPGALVGSNGPDTLVGGPGPDVIYGLGGNDRIDGGGGNDLIFAGSGDDQVAGGDGDDIVCGESGRDSIAGGEGNDLLSGDAGEDRLSGDGGDDRLFGGPDADQLSGGPGNDVCRAGGSPGDLVDCEP